MLSSKKTDVKRSEVIVKYGILSRAQRLLAKIEKYASSYTTMEVSAREGSAIKGTIQPVRCRGCVVLPAVSTQ